MSHYSVLIIGPNPKDQLLPFREKDGDNVPKEYLEFEEIETKYLKQYKKEFTTEWYPKDHTEVKKYQFEIIQKSKGEEISLRVDAIFAMFNAGEKTALDYWIEPKKKSGKRSRKSVYVEVVDSQRIFRKPEGTGSYMYITVKKIKAPAKISFKDKYKTFEGFMAEYCGEDKRDPEKGVYGYWHNPNAKWDWVELGGRWTGSFKLKERHSFAATGAPGLMTAPAKAGYADQAWKRDIDFEAMEKEGMEEAESSWKKIEELLADGKKTDAYFHHGYEGEKKEQFINYRTKFHTFAILKDGKWYEKGQMGWWGMVHKEKDLDKWSEEFSKLISELPDDTLLSVYDCHI